MFPVCNRIHHLYEYSTFDLPKWSISQRFLMRFLRNHQLSLVDLPQLDIGHQLLKYPLHGHLLLCSLQRYRP